MTMSVDKAKIGTVCANKQRTELWETADIHITRVLLLVKHRRAKNSAALTPIKLIPSEQTHGGIYGGHGPLLCVNMTEPNAWKWKCSLEPGKKNSKRGVRSVLNKL